MGTVSDVFEACNEAIANGILIARRSRRDKEFHFQDWFQSRLQETDYNFDVAGRNSYPDFSLVRHPEGFEVKGLGWPGRVATYDGNSQVPTGFHNGRRIFYVFGRYPSDAEDEEYPVIDLVLLDGDFLNADHEYVHENKSFRGFGSYGDIMIRDRKMYVSPTPYALTDGTTGQRTLIVGDDVEVPSTFDHVGDLVRVETDSLVVGYSFDLTTNELKPELSPNPNAGKEHHFRAYRIDGQGSPRVTMKESNG